MQTEKDDKKVNIPLFLRTLDNPEIFHSSINASYYLYAIVLHIGTTSENGHYVSFVREGTKRDSVLSNKKMSKKRKKQQSFSTESCCATNKITSAGLDHSNSWLLFDDETVSPFCVMEDTPVFPYYKYMTESASPCIIFYVKI